MRPSYPNQIPASVGDIVKLSWPNCYCELISVQSHKSIYNVDCLKLELKKICSSNFRPYKKQKIIFRDWFHSDPPLRIEKDSFAETLNNLSNLLSKVR